jgi:hypothetical protein
METFRIGEQPLYEVLTMHNYSTFLEHAKVIFSGGYSINAESAYGATRKERTVIITDTQRKSARAGA